MLVLLEYLVMGYLRIPLVFVFFLNYHWIIIISFLWNRHVKNSLDN